SAVNGRSTLRPALKDLEAQPLCAPALQGRESIIHMVVLDYITNVRLKNKPHKRIMEGRNRMRGRRYATTSRTARGRATRPGVARGTGVHRGRGLRARDHARHR